MRFSLLFIFSVLTVSCFAAWLFQLSDRIVRVKQANAALDAELVALGPNIHLERDLKLLRLADAHRDGATAKVIDKLEAHFVEMVEGQKLDDEFQSDKLTIRKIRSLEIETLEKRAPLRIQLYVPQGKRAKWIIKPYDTLSDAYKRGLKEDVLDFEEPIEIELPVGLSTIVITTEHEFARSSKFEFSLDDKTVAEVKTWPPVHPEKKYHFSGGLIYCVLPRGEASHNGLQPLFVATSIYQDIGENFDSVRAQIGFRCVIELSEAATHEDSNDGVR